MWVFHIYVGASITTVHTPWSRKQTLIEVHWQFLAVLLSAKGAVALRDGCHTPPGKRIKAHVKIRIKVKNQECAGGSSGG